MKFLTVLLSACVVFLSSFSGMDNTVKPVSNTIHCNMAGMQKCGAEKKQNSKNDCSGTCPVCGMMFSCSICGFLPVEAIALKATLFYTITKPVIPYKIGDLSDYHPAGWQPPEA